MHRTATLPALLGLALLAACGDDDGHVGNENLNQNGNQVVPVCGNGVLETGEQCDQGAANDDVAPGACRTSCRSAYCGDFVVDTGESCDDGPQNGVSPSPCRADCTRNVCGDGYVGGGEVCDDGNTVDEPEGCRADCLQDLSRCGDGDLDPGEECDLGELNDDDLPDACRTTCLVAHCGDGVQDSVEVCDDGNTDNDLACSANCLSRCGDGVLNENLGEACDDGQDNGVSPSGCMDQCQLTTPGDGYLGGDEGCDDGNLTDGDGCSASGAVESRYACSGSPSACGCAGYNYGPGCTGCVVFVNHASPAITPTGRTWATAFQTVQEGLDAAASTGQACEVWVARGTYPVFALSPVNTVRLRDRVAVYGGFAGTEALREARDPEANLTELRGTAADDEASRVFHVITANATLDATLDGLTVSGGQANGEAAFLDDRGGGLFAYAAVLTLRNVTFTDCTGEFGAGLAALGGSRIRMEGVVLRGNAATQEGGGAWLKTSEVDLGDLVAEDNTAHSGGALVLERGHAAALGCRVEGNAASDVGGALLLRHGTLELHGCSLARNEATYGGGAAYLGSTSPFAPAGVLRLEDSVVEQNTATTGGAIIGETQEMEARVHLVRTTLQDNAAINDGGAVVTQNGCTLTCLDSTFARNTALGSGGAVKAMGGGDQAGGTVSNTLTLDATGCAFTANTASGSGGAIRAGQVELAQCSLTDNHADQEGGAVHLLGGGRLEGCALLRNRATVEGGALHVENQTGDATTGLGGDGLIRISRSTLLHNQAGRGGAVSLRRGSLHLSSTVLAGNRASTSGGAIYVPQRQATLHLVNSTLMGNQAGSAGGGLHVSLADGGARLQPVAIVSSILWANLPASVTVDPGGTVTALHSDVQGWTQPAPEQDCNDLDPECHTAGQACCSLAGCVDLDGDGFGWGPDCQGRDCDDSDPQVKDWTECGCLDRDGDGLPGGQPGTDLSQCGMAGTPVDCNDDDPDCSAPGSACCEVVPAICHDEDGDGYGIGTLCAGPDCHDGDPTCHTWGTACCEPFRCVDDDADGTVRGPECAPHVIAADPEFVNVPARWSWTAAETPGSSLVLASATGYAVGHVIEIADDGVARTVTGIAGGTISFLPAAGASIPAGTPVTNWGPAPANLTLNLGLQSSSPCLDAGWSCTDDTEGACPFLTSDTDAADAPRVDQPSLPNTGAGTPTYTDLGAFERQ